MTIRYNSIVINKFLTAQTGTAAAAASVTVRNSDTNALAPLFDEFDAPITNPVTTDSDGAYHFYIDSGFYDLIINEGLRSEKKVKKQPIFDNESVMYVNDDLAEIPEASLFEGAQAYCPPELSDYVWYENPNGSGGQWVPKSATSAISSLYSNAVTPAMFGIIGDGSDETVKIQAMFDYAVGKTVYLDNESIYGITAKIIIPADVSLISYNSVFRMLISYADYAIEVGNRFDCDILSVSIVGGASNNGIRVKGALCNIGYLKATSDSASSLFGVRVYFDDSTVLSGNIIGKITTSNFTSGIQLFNCADSEFSNLTCVNYVTGVYIRDMARSKVTNLQTRTTNPAATGGAGNNGLLIESTIANDSTNNLYISNVFIQDSGEHALRVGGLIPVNTIYFNNIHTLNSGAAGAGATGGMGFKVLMNDVIGLFHKNIFVDGLLVEDCSTTGTGAGNFAGVSFGLCDGVKANNVIVRSKNNPYSCWHGLNLYECRNVDIKNISVTDCREYAVRLEGGLGAFVSNEMQDIHIDGVFKNEITVNSPTIKVDTRDTLFERVSINGFVQHGSNAAVYDTGTLGTPFIDCQLNITYKDPLSTAGTPPVTNNNNIRVNYKGPFYGTFALNASNSSIIQDDAGNVRIRKAGVWSIL